MFCIFIYNIDKTLRIIVELASFHPKLKHLGVVTFEDLMMLPFGKMGHNFILVNMFVLAYGAMVAYLLIIKDTVPIIFGIAEDESGSFIERELVMIVTSLIIIVPLSLQRDMASLAFTSLLSVAADVFLVIFIGAYAPIRETVGDAGGLGQVIKDNTINSHIFIGLGILSTAMACQHSAFIVSGSLSEKTSARWATVTFRSLTISTVLCSILGICGYLGFLGETLGDVLNNFEPDTLEANAARSLLAITMFFTYPMEAFVARHVLIKLFFDGDMDGHVLNPSTGQIEVAPLAFGFLTRRAKWTLILYASTLVPALIVNDLGPVLSITGSLGGSCLSYIAPGLVYLGVNGDAFLEYMAAKLNDKARKSAPIAAGDLPIEGDAQANMQTSAPVTIQDASKPWWWYPTLMPLWVNIATTGAQGMKQRIAAFELEHGMSSGGTAGGEDDVETIGPCTRDYYISIFFICFGALAAVAGIFSNIYVQVNDIFFTPTR
jgi:sodium-coupled neutral amino acid transporter 11